MNQNISACWLYLLIVFYFVEGSPMSDLQNLKQLLEEEMNTAPYTSSEEAMEVDGKDRHTEKLMLGAVDGQQWESSDPNNSALAAKENVVARLFKDLVRTSKRSWSRYKKGGMRSCFGVRLDRIGSFSGLGC